jgi:hypothetical protein
MRLARDGIALPAVPMHRTLHRFVQLFVNVTTRQSQKGNPNLLIERFLQ